MSIVKTDNLELFVELIYEFTVKGLCFKADADTLTITLTGGY